MMNYLRRRRLCYVVSSEMTVSAFLRHHIATAARYYDVSVVVNTSDATLLPRLGLTATLHPVAIIRQISLWRDGVALLALVRFFRAKQFDIVHSVSPKAGLLAMFAAWLVGVPCRVHTFTGQVWVTRHGWKRLLLKLFDRLLASLTTRALVDSPSQRDFLVAEGVLHLERAEVIGGGSICGVDVKRFRPDPDARREIRAELNIPPEASVLLFLGRQNRDKGVADLAAGFTEIAGRHPGVHLLLVGPDEDGVAACVDSICSSVMSRVHRVGYTQEPERFMAAADIFCLPSYREGFGMVIIEAAAVGLPAVASRIYGIIDAVVEGETGLLHPPGDVPAIVAALTALLDDDERRITMGNHAQARALANFSQEESSRELLAFYGKMID